MIAAANRDYDRYLLTQALKEVSVKVLLKELSDGEEVLPALKQAPALPHLIHLDLNMVRMNGFDVLAQRGRYPPIGTCLWSS